MTAAPENSIIITNKIISNVFSILSLLNSFQRLNLRWLVFLDWTAFDLFLYWSSNWTLLVYIAQTCLQHVWLLISVVRFRLMRDWCWGENVQIKMALVFPFKVWVHWFDGFLVRKGDTDFTKVRNWCSLWY